MMSIKSSPHGHVMQSFENYGLSKAAFLLWQSAGFGLPTFARPGGARCILWEIHPVLMPIPIFRFDDLTEE
jgi:hypothetical protein